ncbi:cytochrome P450 [Aaosphaeria arxii CBS 175.79]|uniref:Cytochrome P450 n=1 Tax=Aaosphaeria arxii CBS 175.79 TaxID=1450172 RepID=A0A6A5X8V8_9PLEO|nr:cytochrome P450 [Aaosphaeria arxii CBS 175.79]KAF2009398.1 cytochrome P450 [Aaosphaeria arxii CBS 175.79]
MALFTIFSMIVAVLTICLYHVYPHKDPLLGLDFFFKYMSAFKSGTFLDFNKTMYDTYGKTFKANSFGTTLIRTIDPQVSKAVHATYFQNFGLQGLRYETAKHLWGNGIIVVDGPHWQHGRSLIRSSFDIVHIANFARLEKHVQRMMELLPTDGSTIDLMPLFKRLILDTSSEFIFGESMGALSETTDYKRFMDAFERAQRGTGIRAILGRFKFLHRDRTWWNACQEVTDYADTHVEAALLRQKTITNKDGTTDQSAPLRLVDEMAKDTQDKVTLRSHIISVFSPAHDGAAVTLTNAMFHLARNPTAWEPHRLTTIATINQRQCTQSTVLPCGGGIEGKDPLYVQKGDIVEINYRAMCRDEIFWGDNADQFMPERWETIRPGWEYTPFGGGPRSCPGMRLVYTESAYVLVSLLRAYDRIENRDLELRWVEEMRMTAQSKNGCLVGLIRDVRR